MLTSLAPNAKLINCRWDYKLKFRDGLYERHCARTVAMGYQPEKVRDDFESFSPACSHSTTRLNLALTAVSWPGWYSFDLDAVSAFISSHSDLAPGDHVYMKGLAGYNIGEDDCMYMLKCIYSLVQAPRQYYMLCRALYQKAGLKQLQTDECMFIRDVHNIIGQQELTSTTHNARTGTLVPNKSVALSASACQVSLH